MLLVNPNTAKKICGSKIFQAAANRYMNFNKLVTLVIFFRLCNMPQGNSNNYKSQNKTQTDQCMV